VKSIEARRGGALINLDRMLLWSEPLARGWNGYLRALRRRSRSRRSCASWRSASSRG